MPRRPNLTRDEFLNYLSAQRGSLKRGQFRTPIQRFTKLLRRTPTNLLMPNVQKDYSDILKRKKRQRRQRLIQPRDVRPLY